MKRMVCFATIKDEVTRQDVKRQLDDAFIPYKEVENRIKVYYDCYEPGKTRMIRELFESLESHTIHCFW